MNASDRIDAGPIVRIPCVLLVDDDAVSLELCNVALQARGFDTLLAPSGEEALAMLRVWQPDAVILDAMMPGMDGFEACRRLRATRGFEAVPVLMLTGLDDDASIQRAFDAGATDFYVKSTQWTLLVQRLRYLLRAFSNRMELERSQARLARAQDLARIGSVEWQLGARAPLLSPEARQVLGVAADEQVSWRQLLRKVDPRSRSRLALARRQAARRGTALACDIQLCNGSDARAQVVHVEAEGPLDMNGKPAGYSGIVQDVTERQSAHLKIHQLANFDALTDLPNRAQLQLRSERAIEHAQTGMHGVALLHLNLDRFKVINDTLGHAAGDELLREVARRLRTCVRHYDAPPAAEAGPQSALGVHRLECVARLGGDEFAALLPEVADAQHAQAIAQRLVEALGPPVLLGGQECFVSASVGVALFPRDALNAADLLRNANVAMSAVKAQGRDAVLQFSPALAGKGRARLELESALHKAIERDELVLHYQPKIDASGARMLGAEALMRWRRGGTLVSPADFIPVAEESGLIVQMSEWALFEAARQAGQWRKRFGFNGSIAVNLPNRVFERNDLIDTIHAAVTAADVPHASLALEITETGLMKDLQSAIPTLHRLEAIGVEVSIDDFGTGYSSLAYLTTLPIAELKIDRSFVKNLGRQTQSAAVIAAIMALARSLSLRVVAEGVETVQQMEILARLGCTLMQGFLFSKALPPRELEVWVEQGLPKIRVLGSQAGAAPAVVAPQTARVAARVG
jgi:predicted signal transduction protein with EAL and GGDEF domain/DNA-binding response OmpR family regulator